MIRPETQQAVEAALARGDIAGAARRAEAALAQGEVHSVLLNLAAWAREEAGDFAGAGALLDRALQLAPGDPQVMVGKAAVLRKQSRLSEAVRTADAAIAADPGNPAAWLERGYILDAGNSIAAARDSYERAAALDPGMAPALAGVAAMASRAGDHAAARAFAERALALDPGDVAAASALARVELEAGDAPAAAARLQALAERPLPPGSRLQVQGLLGDARAKAGQAAAAFHAYEAANAAWRDLHGKLVDPARPTHRALVEGVIAGLTESAWPWPPLDLPPVPGEAGRHLVLCGYPRSGNTLVENVLASLPGVVAIEERPTLADGDAWLAADRLPELGGIAAADAGRLRAAYWAKVAACGVAPGAAALVDMDPLKSVQLPLVARLFPAAGVVLMRRDPRDVVWSCFHTNFAPNPSTFEFSSLERAARHYDAVMRLTELCLERLPLSVLVVHYEALVGDFDAETRRICDFAGLEWTPALRRFDRTARARGVSTASVTQVHRGLYNGAGQWRPFAAQLAPVMPLLAPWVERFGYAD
jgi:tetratricopeptide (TPR) repeat protein